MDFEDLPRSALIRLLQEQDAASRDAGKNGIVMSYTGRTAPWQIIRLVKPKLHKIIKRYSFGEEALQAQNEIWDGENLSTMVTLYKHRGQVDLIITDPPYNTGEDFRYNDKWDKDPNDPDLGELVARDDGSRHSKWLKFMTPRIWMMREMLRPGGVVAVCIDHRELYRLGMLMDEIFKEENRIGIINWQKAYSPKNDTGGKRGGLSSATEYVLVYSKDSDRAKTGLLDRTDAMNSRYTNPDDDPDGDWASDNPAGAGSDTHPKMVYAIQSPFTGLLYYPPEGSHWRNEKARMRVWLQAWGSEYEEKWIDDGNEFLDSKSGKTAKVKALVIKGAKFVDGEPAGPDSVLLKAREAATNKYNAGHWPRLIFTGEGNGGPRVKRYLKEIKKGKVPMTYWADEEYDEPLNLESQSWDHEESGHSQTGVSELDAVVGKGHDFKTVKPLKLIKKIIQIWCRPEGVVLDPFAGSGTTGHAVLELNAETDAKRRFILIEQGNTEKGDHYAKTLTAERVRRVITGDWASGKRTPLDGGFRFIELQRGKIDANAVNALAREEMIDLLLTSYWNKAEKAKSYLRRLPSGSYRYLFAVNPKSEGFFLIWDAPDADSVLNRDAFKKIVEEAKAANLNARYHIYASVATYTGRSIEFYKIPDSVLEQIGFNPRSDAYNNESAEDTVDA
ncbi:type III restriction-modification system methylation subunit [Burkholderia pseudomallei]|uniref:site-specific DNA-methyltransferase n=1 Tax=Burkholderia pseudomallei TaxID=28450 RepID=UPI000F0876A7|nr:site-specific DNA-methyltransferase [Burkholderia pseudomallei]MBF3969418.1 site-specific DNA-methyltransferase [Burkholderia pseudomallei]CAJ2856999.1 type III restriction-modification system methylation subunit [Burkholderia pseudomallei]CAJ2925205.1 type III restriction-modification system methylation subunit [Burkholderia pseudomallei]CAJ2930305.1 type III restriction-modification system methylation subunit [Burkholderia pseudomallei]CAJ2941405.1 type III restriction-modification system